MIFTNKDEQNILSAKSNSQKKIIVTVSGVKIGTGFCVIAGPCTIESREQLFETAEKIKNAGASILRGGAFKLRTSPYAFQGLREDGIKLLIEAKNTYNLPIVSEITDISQLDLFSDVDIIQVGARNMQNYELLRQLGKSKKPILLKRGLSATVYDLLMSAEYIMSGGNENVILCERGIRTFEKATRNTLDLSAIPVINEESCLPIIVDPSHALGVAKYVRPMSLASAAAGADGLIIEVHNNPATALCDAEQAITSNELSEIIMTSSKIFTFVNKNENITN